MSSRSSTDHPTMKLDIMIVPNAIQVLLDQKVDTTGYCVSNVSGLYACFQGRLIHTDHIDLPKAIASVVPGLRQHCSYERFPCELFLGKKENDIVMVDLIGENDPVTVELRCKTQDYRYASCGKFEDLLYELTKSFGGMYSDTILPYSTQLACLLVNHERVSRAFGKPVIDPLKFRFSDSYINICRMEVDRNTSMGKFAAPSTCPSMALPNADETSIHYV